MNKFTNNQSSEETTAAYLYELEEAHRQEEQELTEIADAQWEAFQNDHDDYGDELDEHDLQIAQAQWEAEQYEAEWDAANDECEQADIDAGWVTPATKEEVSEWLAEQDAPFAFMEYDDPDYWV